MDLELTDDQAALRDGIRALLADRFPSDRVRAGFDRSVHDELAAAGVFSLRTDGFAWADAAVVFEQLGEACVPGPLVATLVAHGHLEGPVGLVEAPGAAVVEHPGAIDHVLVLDGPRVGAVARAELAVEPLDWPLDPLTPVGRARVTGGAPLPLDGTEVCRAGAVLTAALLVGLAQRATDLSVAYAKEREQFDRPIGAFQAVKHLLADMLVRTEVARAATYAAAAHLDAPDVAGLDRAVATAKAVAGDAAIANGKSATQVHGGMGYTWEVDVHLYLKRAWVLDTHFGSADHHADAVAATLG